MQKMPGCLGAANTDESLSAQFCWKYGDFRRKSERDPKLRRDLRYYATSPW